MESLMPSLSLYNYNCCTIGSSECSGPMQGFRDVTSSRVGVQPTLVSILKHLEVLGSTIFS